MNSSMFSNSPGGALQDEDEYESECAPRGSSSLSPRGAAPTVILGCYDSDLTLVQWLSRAGFTLKKAVI